MKRHANPKPERGSALYFWSIVVTTGLLLLVNVVSAWGFALCNMWTWMKRPVLPVTLLAIQVYSAITIILVLRSVVLFARGHHKAFGCFKVMNGFLLLFYPVGTFVAIVVFASKDKEGIRSALCMVGKKRWFLRFLAVALTLITGVSGWYHASFDRIYYTYESSDRGWSDYELPEKGRLFPSVKENFQFYNEWRPSPGRNLCRTFHCEWYSLNQLLDYLAKRERWSLPYLEPSPEPNTSWVLEYQEERFKAMESKSAK